jgi:hypothetical protein
LSAGGSDLASGAGPVGVAQAPLEHLAGITAYDLHEAEKRLGRALDRIPTLEEAE